MPNVQPIQQPPIEDLKNALAIADMWQRDLPQGPASAFAGIARLLRHALTELSEPNLAAMQAGEILIRELNGTVESQRNLRDTVAGILNAQLTGNVPKTWSPE